MALDEGLAVTASERLRELIDAPVNGQAEYLQLANRLADALPLIADVVEAVELEPFAFVESATGRAAVAVDLGDWQRVMKRVTALRDALEEK